MKLNKFMGASSALCLSAIMVQAQETNKPADFEQRMKQMQEMFEQREHDMEARFEKKIAAQDAEIEALKKQVGGGTTNPPAAAAAACGTRKGRGGTPPYKALDHKSRSEGSGAKK